MVAVVDAKKTQKQGKDRVFAGAALMAFILASVAVAAKFAGVDGAIIGAVVSIVGSVSILSKIRSGQTHIVDVELDQKAQSFLDQIESGDIRLLAHRVSAKDYRLREEEARQRNSIQIEEGGFIFLEIDTTDPNTGKSVVEVKGVVLGDYMIFRCKCQSAPVAIASILLAIRNKTNKIPHVFMGWTDAHPLSYAWKFILFGEGETAPLTRDLIRRIEPQESKRPYIHVA